MPRLPLLPKRIASRAGVVWVLLAALAVVSAEGCRCRAETAAERAAREAAEEAARLEEQRRRREEELAKRAVVLTTPVVQPGPLDKPSLFAKPGHWSSVTQPAKANANDFDGVLSLRVTDKSNTPIPAPRTGFHLDSRRPLVVASGAAKDIETLVYFPLGDFDQRLRPIVRNRRSGALESDVPAKLRTLLDHQHHLVVFAKQPSRYGFLDSLYAVTSPLPARIDATPLRGEAGTLEPTKNYRVVGVPADSGARTPALPDDPFAWTSTAYLVWDGADPDLLRPAQRNAIVQWVHWGGQLIVSGPDSLDLLRGSSLEPLLAAGGAETVAFTDDHRQRFAAAWGVGESTDGKPPFGGEWTGVRLTPTDDAQPLPGLEGLLYERRVGRGRTVVSAFKLDDQRLVRWSAGVENFFNAAILRRPRRRFFKGDYEGDPPNAGWAGAKNDADRFRLDPLLGSTVRYFTRDAFDETSSEGTRALPTEQPDEGVLFNPAQNKLGGALPPRLASGFWKVQPPKHRGGPAAWNDTAPVPRAVASVLRESAGVSVPSAGFVVGCLAFYLLAIVPANWGFFYAIGRVEWAWVAAPVIALLGAAGVIRQAQLDIGFVRSRTEVAVLETHQGAPRGVLSRFTALYTSLSATYDLTFDGQAVAAPFAKLDEQDPSLGSVTRRVAFERREKTRLTGLVIDSASAELVRSDEAIDVSLAVPDGSSRVGRIELERSPGGPRLLNTTRWDLRDVAVVRRPDGVQGEPTLEGCWIGELRAGKAASVVFLPIFPEGERVPFVAERVEAARLYEQQRGDRLDLEPLFRIAFDPSRFEPGESRVVARLDEILPGLTIEPASSQRNGATLVVAHLGFAPLPPPASDVNTPSDFRKKVR